MSSVLLSGFCFLCLFCFPALGQAQNWTQIKDTIQPVIELPLEFDSVYAQPLANLGWEDGLHISSDGLHLYCTYVPIDLLSFSLNGSLPNNYSTDYDRGAPDFGMDLVTNPLNEPEWLHSDILYATRPNTASPFTTWTLANMARPFYSEGAPTPAFSSGNMEYLLFTSNDNQSNNSDIWWIATNAVNPSGVGNALPAPVATTFNEDNPHLHRIDANILLLYFDSDNLPGGLGDIDLWYSLSTDNGNSWGTPVNATSINTADKEHQPFLHRDLESGTWYLYYSANHTDGKLAIFRAAQNTPNDWNDWGSPELVVSAGNAAGIGEPTVTATGDLSFVVVVEDPDQTSMFNRFDSDPWFLRRKVSTSIRETTLEETWSIYPNPAIDFLEIKTGNYRPKNVTIFNSLGGVVYHNKWQTPRLDISALNPGVYLLSLQSEAGQSFTRFVKH